MATNHWTSISTFSFSADFVNKVKAICKEAHSLGITLASADGKTIINAEAAITDKYICLNGLRDQGHETFVLAAIRNSETFCKTNNKPYEAVVKAILALAKGYGYVHSVSYDNGAGYADIVARKLLDKVGFKANEKGLRWE